MVYRLTESALDGAVTDSDTTIPVDLISISSTWEAGLGAAVNSYILIGSEVMKVDILIDDFVMTATRAQHGTTAAATRTGRKYSS